MLHYKCNMTHITPYNTEYEVCIYYNPPPIKFVTLINKMNHKRCTALERSIINYGEGGGRGGLNPVLWDSLRYSIMAILPSLIQVAMPYQTKMACSLS